MKAFSPKSTPEVHRSPSSVNAYSHRQAQQQIHPATLIQRAKLDPRSLTPRDVLQLQRTIGNHAVGQLLTQGGLSSEADTSRAAGFVDNRPEAIAQRKLQAMMHQSPQVQRQTPLQAMIDNRPRQVAQQKQLERMFGPAVQRQEGVDEEALQMQAEPGTLQRQSLEDEALLQGKVEPVQRQEELEDEELIQGKSDPVPRQDLEEEEAPLQGTFDSSTTPTPPEYQENHTGMPDHLKAGIENLSGMSMDDVTVHYNSSTPAQLQALAYTQGTDIHVGPGRQKHLPHEAWHVVQQKQGRVKPTMRAKGVAINADTGLEHEADVMGAKAMQMRQADPLPTGPAVQATTAESRERVQPEAAEAPRSDVGASGEKGRLNFLSSDLVFQKGVQEKAVPLNFISTLSGTNAETLQRYVMKRSSPTGWVYSSSYEPTKTYATEEEAQEADTKLEAEAQGSGMEWEEGTRFPTIYSYTHISSNNQMSDKPQGPHTAPHILIDQAFGKLQYQDEFLMVFYEQVPTLEDVRAIILKEKGGKFGGQEFELERFLFDYTSLYNSIETAIWSGQTRLGIIQLQLRMMLERNPYATYALKTNKPASKAALKYKKENRNSQFLDAVDSRGSSKFRDKEGYDEFIAQREMLVDDKYKLTQEEIEFDGQLDGEYSCQKELVGAVLSEEEVVGNWINLYPTGEWQIVRIEIIYENNIPVNAKVRLKRRGG